MNRSIFQIIKNALASLIIIIFIIFYVIDPSYINCMLKVIKNEVCELKSVSLNTYRNLNFMRSTYAGVTKDVFDTEIIYFKNNIEKWNFRVVKIGIPYNIIDSQILNYFSHPFLEISIKDHIYKMNLPITHKEQAGWNSIRIDYILKNKVEIAYILDNINFSTNETDVTEIKFLNGLQRLILNLKPYSPINSLIEENNLYK